MLKHLHIQNYALISELDIDLSSGFSVITGETGAGKSIILGALALIRGERADIRSITEGETKAVVEAQFDISGYDLRPLFEDNDLDFDNTCIIRRELMQNGKSRAFVNDTPVGLGVLRSLSEKLIDIHSQHENLLLKDDSFQLEVIDSVAENASERSVYTEKYNQYQQTVQQLSALRAKAEKSRADADYVEFQFRQLDEARLQSGEEETLEQELRLLEHAEEIKSALESANTLLADETAGAITTIKDAISALRKVAQYLPQELTERLNSTYIELRDIADEAAHIEANTEFDPTRLQQTEERLDLLNTLMQKHRCQTADELIALRDSLQAEMLQNENYDEEIAALSRKLEADRQALQTAADTLSATRRNTAEPIAAQLEQQLSVLGIQHAKMQVSITETDDFTPSGKDLVQFLFAANLNQTLRPVADVASGGEIARLMLTIKALTAARKGLPTIIFDEVDTGVSGEVADNIGSVMQRLAAGRQIIAITHLPQIAVKGSAHYKVYKHDTATRTETHIRLLTQDERITEIATLLSGENISEAAITNAKELLQL
ncbi:MAG: DNA repair protein RecN [Paludibacteraceae bacterium]|nr:DNA repair protein RecN [Paludibacteraceae bacterium]